MSELPDIAPGVNTFVIVSQVRLLITDVETRQFVTYTNHTVNGSSTHCIVDFFKSLYTCLVVWGRNSSVEYPFTVVWLWKWPLSMYCHSMNAANVTLHHVATPERAAVTPEQRLYYVSLCTESVAIVWRVNGIPQSPRTSSHFDRAAVFILLSPTINILEILTVYL